MSAYVEKKLHNNLAEYFPAHNTRSKLNIAAVIEKAIAQMMYWMERSRQRRELAALDDHMLEDIGLTRDDVQKELAKPFWC